MCTRDRQISGDDTRAHRLGVAKDRRFLDQREFELFNHILAGADVRRDLHHAAGRYLVMILERTASASQRIGAFSISANSSFSTTSSLARMCGAISTMPQAW